MADSYRVSDFKESARNKGTMIHSKYRKPYKTWNRHVLMGRLEYHLEGNVYSRKIDNLDGAPIRVIGVPDDFETDGKKVSIVEVYTTIAPTIQAVKAQTITKKILQLQTYVWVMSPIIKKLGYALSDTHWLEIYEQDTGEQLDRIAVTQREDIEDAIRIKVSGGRGKGKSG